MLLRVAAILGPLLLPALAFAQDSCQMAEAVALACPDGTGIEGTPPNCSCNGNPIFPLEASCDRNFPCFDSSLIGTGTWPNCGCARVDGGEAGGGTDGGEGSEPVPDPDEPSNGGSGTDAGPTDVGGGLGGVDVCSQFYTCPSGTAMAVENGQCVCEVRMLAPALR